MELMCMDDVETIRIIKEKETSADEEINEFKMEQEKIIREAREKETIDLEKTEEELKAKYQEYLESKRREAEQKASAIIEGAKAKASQIRLNIQDKDLEKMLLDIITEYLEE